MSDRENADEPASDLLESAAQCAAPDLLDLAAQLAGLAEDLKALAAKPIVPPSTLVPEPDDQPRASSSAVSEAPLLTSRNAARSLIPAGSRIGPRQQCCAFIR